MALSTDELVSHILDEAEFLSSQIKRLTKSDYMHDEVLKPHSFGASRSLERQ